VQFLENPKIPLDTNGVERALRGVAVGRKNHYGSRSERGFSRLAGSPAGLIKNTPFESSQLRKSPPQVGSGALSTSLDQ
jgi:curved DNA-binding protein CbpA